MFLLTSVFTRLALLSTLALVSGACAIITGPGDGYDGEQDDLARARRTWNNNRIEDYEFVVRRNCFCALGGVSVLVVVQNDIVVAREVDGTGAPIPGNLAYAYPSIDGLFGVIQDAIDQRAYEIETDYDRDYGFPTDFYIDYRRGVADDEEGYVLVRFRSLP